MAEIEEIYVHPITGSIWTKLSWVCYPNHIDSAKCWCEPVLEYEDPETGNQVWVHNDIQ